MKPRRATIAVLKKLVVVSAVAFVAIHEASENWTFVAFVVVAATLIDATIHARYGVREERVRCFGFALFGWVHFGISNGPAAAYLPTIYFLPQLVLKSVLPVTLTKDQGLVFLWFLSLVFASFGGFATVHYVAWLQRRARSPVREVDPEIGLSDYAARSN